MSNDFYAASGAPATNSFGYSAAIRSEFALVQSAFDKFPTLAGNANKVLVANSGGTALAYSDTLALTALTVSAASSLTTLNVSSTARVLGVLAVNGAVLGGGNSHALAVTGSAIFQGGEISASGYGVRLLNSTAQSGGGLYSPPGTGQGVVLATDAGPLNVSTNGAIRLTVDAAGLVSIAGAAVAAQLQVNLNTNAYPITLAAFVLNNTNATGQSAIDFRLSNSLAARLRCDYAGSLTYVTTSSGNHTFLTGGDVGVGATRLTISSTTVTMAVPATAPSFNGFLANGNISQWTNDAGYISSVGTLASLNVTGTVTAGGLTANGNGGTASVSAVRPSTGFQASFNLATASGTTWQLYLQSASNNFRIYYSGIGADLFTLDATTGNASFAAQVTATQFNGPLNGAAPAGSLSGTTLAAGVTASSLTTVAANCTLAGVPIGFRGLPSASVTTGAFTAADAGKCVYGTGGITVPNATMSPGDVIVLQDTSGSAQTITASITTLRQTGTANTGNRTLKAYGRASIVFVSSTLAFITGDVT